MYSYNFLSIQFTLMILSIMASAPSYMRLQTLLSTIFIDSIRSLGEFPVPAAWDNPERPLGSAVTSGTPKSH